MDLESIMLWLGFEHCTFNGFLEGWLALVTCEPV